MNGGEEKINGNYEYVCMLYIYNMILGIL